MDENEIELWRALQRTVDRRDLFWVFFYADQLSTLWARKRAKEVIPVIQLDA